MASRPSGSTKSGSTASPLGPRGRRLGEAVLQSAPLRPARVPGAEPSAQAPDRRADVRPLRDFAPGHGRSVSPDHFDVYITDWADARMVPLAVGSFDLDDYIDYLREALAHLGPGVHTIGVCQPSVPLLAAAALMEAGGDRQRPRQHDPDGRPGRHETQSDRGQQARREARRRMVPPQLPAYRAVPLSGLRAGGLSGLSPALRLHGDESRPPCQRALRHVQPSGVRRRRFGGKAPRVLRRIYGGDGSRRRILHADRRDGVRAPRAAEGRDDPSRRAGRPRRDPQGGPPERGRREGRHLRGRPDLRRQ